MCSLFCRWWLHFVNTIFVQLVFGLIGWLEEYQIFLQECSCIQDSFIPTQNANTTCMCLDKRALTFSTQCRLCGIIERTSILDILIQHSRAILLRVCFVCSCMCLNLILYCLIKMPFKRIKSYTAGFKLQVPEREETIGTSTASREFEVDKKYVGRWQKDEEKFICMPKFKHANCCGTAQVLELKEN